MLSQFPPPLKSDYDYEKCECRVTNEINGINIKRFIFLTNFIYSEILFIWGFNCCYSLHYLIQNILVDTVRVCNICHNLNRSFIFTIRAILLLNISSTLTITLYAGVAPLYHRFTLLVLAACDYNHRFRKKKHSHIHRKDIDSTLMPIKIIESNFEMSLIVNRDHQNWSQ